jgi:hypothetical protein
MKIYTLRADVAGYRGLYYQKEEDIVEFNRRFDGAPLGKRWTGKEKFAFLPRRLPKGDTPGLSTHIPVFSPNAAKTLADFLKLSGELLPISCDKKEYFVFNVTKVVDALDRASSNLKLFSDGEIMDVIRYAFFPKRLIGIELFKIPQMVLADVFVTDPFVERVESAGLKGFKFRLVWSSD